MTKLIVALRNFANAPKKKSVNYSEIHKNITETRTLSMKDA